MGQAAHEAIPGSHWYHMPNMGHFPMSESPELFIEYVLESSTQSQQIAANQFHGDAVQSIAR